MDNLASVVNNLLFSFSRMMAKSKSWKQNVAFSPLSIAIQLAILTKGSSNNTKQQIRDLTNEEFLDELKKVDFMDFSETKFAFKLFHSVKLSKKFIRQGEKLCNLEFMKIEFSDICQSAININNWLNEEFQKFCGVNIDCGYINPKSTILLATICFMNSIRWEEIPSPSSISFRVNNDKTFIVNSNKHVFYGKFFESKKFQIKLVAIPLNPQQYEAIIILPNNNIPLKSFLKHFSVDLVKVL